MVEQCKFCAAWDKPPDEWEINDLILTGAPLYTYVGDGKDYVDMPLNYCPVCGRKLASPYSW